MRIADRRQPPLLEICVDSVAAARAAIAGGADGIELCAALQVGGLTPSTALAEAVVAIAKPAGAAVRAMVRPRAGDFAYDRDEMALAVEEARALLATGVDGLVFGVARDGVLDTDALVAWCAAVVPPSLTLHRAVDTVADPLTAVDAAIALGVDRMLSSGGRRTAVEGIATLAAMTRRAAGRCCIVAGAGVRPDNVGAFAAAGIRAVHASARAYPAAGQDAARDPFGFGRASPPADEATVRALRRALDVATTDRPVRTPA